MTGPATQQVKEFRKPTAKEREHIVRAPYRDSDFR